jgi:hypothetical protein
MPAWVSGTACGHKRGLQSPHIYLGHVEYPIWLDVDNLGIPIATLHLGDGLDTLLTFPDHPAGLQPCIEAAHL